MPLKLKSKINEKSFLIRFIRFSVSSSSTTVLDLLILFCLTEFFKVYYLLSSGISFITSNSVNYFINRRWGFKDSETNISKGYLLFLVFGIFGLSLTVFLMWVLVSLLSFNYLFARILVAMFEGTISFFLHAVFTFKVVKKVPLMGFMHNSFQK